MNNSKDQNDKSYVKKQTKQRRRKLKKKHAGMSDRDTQYKGKKSESSYSDAGYMSSLEAPNIITQNNNKDNDANWYMNLDPIARDYASLPMSQALGLRAYNWERLTNDYYSTSGAGMIMYGLMTISFIPTIGPNDSGSTAPINLAAQELYTLTRRANSGAKNYDKTDLMMVIMAMDSAYMLYEDMLRAYRVMSTFSSVNRYYPNGILQSLGYDPSLTFNIAQFRGILDVFAYKLASINIPDQMDIIKRHSWMCSNIYLDDDTNKSQSYAFVPRTLYKWTEGVGDTPTHLSPRTIHQVGTQLSLADITNLIDEFMNPILGSEDVGVITGDMAKAFSEAGMIKIKPVEDYAALVPVYSSEVLMQIRNVFSVPSVPTVVPGADMTISPVLSSTVKGPYLQQKIACIPGADGGRRVHCSPMLNFVTEDATPENVMVATRLISVVSAIGSGGISNFLYYGTEVVVEMRVWYLNDTGVMAGYSIDQDLALTTSMSYDNMNDNFGRIQACSQFNNCPANYLFTQDGANKPLYIGPTINVNNYIYLDDETLKNLHDAATMSLFTVKDYKLAF